MPLPQTTLDAPLTETVGEHTISTAYIGPFVGDPSRAGRWSTVVVGRDDIDEHVSSDRSAVLNWRAHVRELLAGEAVSPSDAAIERAHYELDVRGRATTATVGLLEAVERTSERARSLYAALTAWGDAGLGGVMSLREHDAVFARLGAAFLEQVLADRAKDPALVGELAASVGVPC